MARALEDRDVAADEFEAVYARHARDVFRYGFVFLRNVSEAEDLVAETFERACRAWSAGRRPAGPPLPWLLLVARRILIDRTRRRRPLGWLPLNRIPSGLEPATEGEPERTEFWLWFGRLAEALTPRQREVLLLRYQLDMPDEQIGQVLGLSSAGVRSLAARALGALREHPELLS